MLYLHWDYDAHRVMWVHKCNHTKVGSSELGPAGIQKLLYHPSHLKWILGSQIES